MERQDEGSTFRPKKQEDREEAVDMERQEEGSVCWPHKLEMQEVTVGMHFQEEGSASRPHKREKQEEEVEMERQEEGSVFWPHRREEQEKVVEMERPEEGSVSWPHIREEKEEEVEMEAPEEGSASRQNEREMQEVLETERQEEGSASRPHKRGKQEEVVSRLPDELVEKIVAMLPFPCIFKARGLSKAWLARFSSIRSQDDEEMKLRASLFHKQVSERSNNWDTFCLAYACEKGFSGYNLASKKWRSLPPLGGLPKDLLPDVPRPKRAPKPLMWLEGPLLYGFVQGQSEVYVANILTRSCKQLPPRPNAHTYICPIKLVTDPSAGTYKLILLCVPIVRFLGRANLFYSVDIYDSTLGAWFSKHLDPSIFRLTGPSTPAYLDGVVYFVGQIKPRRLRLLAFNVETGTVGKLRVRFANNRDRLEDCKMDLVVCNGKRLLCSARNYHKHRLSRPVCTRNMYFNDAGLGRREVGTLRVFEVDLGSLQLVELPGGRRNVAMDYSRPVCEGNSILFRPKGGREVAVYNVDEKEWSTFPVPKCAGGHKKYSWVVSLFQPGLCPFMPVSDQNRLLPDIIQTMRLGVNDVQVTQASTPCMSSNMDPPPRMSSNMDPPPRMSSDTDPPPRMSSDTDPPPCVSSNMNMDQ